MARSTTEWMKENNVSVLDGWLNKGDDINPIENFWAILDERLQKRKFRSMSGMKLTILEEWNNFNQSTIGNLIKSIPDRLRKIIMAKSGSIKRIH